MKEPDKNRKILESKRGKKVLLLVNFKMINMEDLYLYLYIKYPGAGLLHCEIYIYI